MRVVAASQTALTAATFDALMATTLDATPPAGSSAPASPPAPTNVLLDLVDAFFVGYKGAAPGFTSVAFYFLDHLTAGSGFINGVVHAFFVGFNGTGDATAANPGPNGITGVVFYVLHTLLSGITAPVMATPAMTTRQSMLQATVQQIKTGMFGANATNNNPPHSFMLNIPKPEALVDRTAAGSAGPAANEVTTPKLEGLFGRTAAGSAGPAANEVTTPKLEGLFGRTAASSAGPAATNDGQQAGPVTQTLNRVVDRGAHFNAPNPPSSDRSVNPGSGLGPSSSVGFGAHVADSNAKGGGLGLGPHESGNSGGHGGHGGK
ncbi:MULTISPECIES: hypothetical protein [unclassified Mycolicibacterium]|uniref:hypothetical protein n=1 Tax=unclassified Mycolicibacterium TaxID=2636767 RepID=UPI0012DCC62E|nr:MULTISPECIES: hypothetical protein [unclassified Mycolicibacterium]MUL83173.1 hypothetical protein [Mycolicibacterium sp. CBMA 329]MUL89508.1 hypothetical protein [Mycolicibacterium sp. CBMA 331]MUM02735.1 hypothetical protein [Mycolicibacterium sp. CBMA 334]MUM39024.1 hypothetical protein [Mycolicibacterium sp. CBMA 247]MUM45572.1 hypothetical protein [Mycolicibacterium sp. CBMA 294]